MIALVRNGNFIRVAEPLRRGTSMNFAQPPSRFFAIYGPLRENRSKPCRTVQLPQWTK